MTGQSTAVSLNKITKYFGLQTAFANVSFDVPSGQVVALLGPSGAGKSTVLRCINHLEKISAGRIYVYDDLIGYRERDGRLYELSDREISRQRQVVGMVFQHFNLFRHMTVLQNVICAQVHVLKRPKVEARDIAMENLRKVGLEAKSSSYPAQLSGGQQQRVAIARALAVQPRVLLLDEPTSALDPELAQEVVLTIRELAREGQTMMIATHDMGIARDVADRVIFMENGAVVEDALSQQFFKQPQNERARQFLAKILHAHD
ncbi:amino acid ABC transporter ATP-binding protein [Bartonella sp. LJL80]